MSEEWKMADIICAHACDMRTCNQSDDTVHGAVWGSGEKYINNHNHGDMAGLYYHERIVEQLQQDVTDMKGDNQCLIVHTQQLEQQLQEAEQQRDALADANEILNALIDHPLVCCCKCNTCQADTERR